MKHVVYYPGIEVKNQNWLKFALLFFDKVDTIVPEEGNRLISDLYKQIEDETGFLKRYKPEYKEDVKASLDSIDQFERILRTPERFDRYSAIQII